MKTHDLTDEQQADEILSSIRTQFASLMHHELRTPLASIVGATCLLESELDGLISPDSMHLLDILKRNTLRLQRLLENLLELQRVAVGDMTFKLESVELRSLLEEIAATDAAHRDRHRFRWGRLRGAVVLADRAKLVRAIGELLASLRGLARGASDIRLRLEMRATSVCMHLSDTALASGAPEDVSDSESNQDAGIGLALAKELVVGMGGEISIDTAVSQATIRLANAASETFAGGRHSTIQQPDDQAICPRPDDQEI